MEVDTKIMLETFKQKYISLQILWLTMIMPPYEFIPLVYCVFGCTAGFYMLLSVLQVMCADTEQYRVVLIYNFVIKAVKKDYYISNIIIDITYFLKL